MSDDNGQTWRVLRVPGVDDGDQTYDRFPDVASDRGGRAYYAASSRGRPVVSTSDDHGRHWVAPVQPRCTGSSRVTSVGVLQV